MNLETFFGKLDQLPRTSSCGGVPIDDLVSLLRQLELQRSDVAEYVNFSPDCYKRNLMRLGPPLDAGPDLPAEAYAALIMCWGPGQRSPIHDHRGSACAVRVIEGSCRETRYDRCEATGSMSPKQTTTYAEGSVCGSFDADVHELVNDNPQRDLITMHIYTPPLTYVHLYNKDTGEVGRCEDTEVANARAALAS